MADKIRVVQVIKTLNINGAERFAIDLALCLDPRQYEVQICAFFQDNSPIEKHWHQKLSDSGINTWYATPWPGQNNYGSYLRGTQTMEHHLRNWPADILHTHFQPGTGAGLYCRSRGLARHVVRTAHNHRRKEWSTGLYGWLLYQLVSGWVYPLACDAEVGVSLTIAAELRSSPGARFARRQAQCITTAIPSDLIERAQVYPRPAREEGRFIVGSIGRLTPQKGYTYLLQAIPQVRAALPGTELWLIGDGELRAELEEQARRLGIADAVRFLGRQNDVLAWLRQMDLFVLPSLWEGFAMVIMESMAAGIPVLATDIAGTRDMVQTAQNGWLVPPANPAALADQIITALRDPAGRERMTANALLSLEAVKIERITAQYSQLYQDLVSPQ
jgi:glycosyltransferase involved in cell wall biosynthesis